MSINKQVGQPLLIVKPPVFAGMVVRGGTWEEDDAGTLTDEMNESEEVFNTTKNDPAREASCELYVIKPDVGDPAQLPLKNEVLSEAAPSTEKWLVKDSKKKRLGGHAVIYAVKLRQSTAQDLTKIDVE